MKPKYIVAEIQTNDSGTVSSIATAYDDYYKAESKYHTVLAAAALSNLPVHSAVLLDNLGGMIHTQSYTRTNIEEE